MAKARTTLTISIRMKMPVGQNASEVMNFVRRRLAGEGIPDNMIAPQVEKIEEAIKHEDTVVKLVQKLTEYK
jgi:hypothetical protein